jgi:cation transport ATPase
LSPAATGSAAGRRAVGAEGALQCNKTGTVTAGTPMVVDVPPAFRASGDDLLGAAAIAERRSEHPLGKAMISQA